MYVKDCDGERTRAGDRVRFSYGIPPIGVTAKVVEIRGALYALTPGHKPLMTKLRRLSYHVGAWHKVARHGRA